MTQLSLFDAIAPVSPVVVPASAVTASEPAASSASKPSSASSNDSGRTDDSGTSLLALAELIREGREQLAAHRGTTQRPIQRIGDLAQAVLHRHDLVARRRAASRQKANDFDAATDNVQVAS
ncbi:hypothetical protein LOC71_10280 [Rhodopirellula sp. JC740]|uniref:Uncharacterized protein n=1 Tax=Rhodopirellula halodulae TaxID=2894198 RepID=A0ABS8NGH3_9BACT|nr:MULTISPECIES: hypothetical protein [unclassified Rhodopirellula]MCC9642663.1 hypothetical protein [Rhodopirellula sp. JC740]MCC9656036.1 hypothetical protein [Rhodopirellula sp. JC737]